MRMRGIKGKSGQTATQVVAGLALVLALPGCKKADESGQYVCGEKDRVAYINQSAEYKASEGDGILPVKSKDPIVNGYFGKAYNQDWLMAVSRASILETIDYIETKGVSVYKAPPISKMSKRPLASASVLSWDLEREWQKADHPMAGSQCGFLAGLYLSREARGLPSLRDQAAIIVRADASRWTLVHEFMHHNFKSQAIARGYSDNIAQNRRISLLKDIDTLKRSSQLTNKEYAQKFSALFQEVMKVADELVVQYQYEEVTIEATLQDLYEKGQFGYVPSGAYANATWYIAQSKKSAEEMYRGLNAAYDEIYRLTATNGLFDDMKKISKYTTIRDQRLAELDEVIQRRKVLGSRSSRFAASMDVTPMTGSTPCAEAQEVEHQMAEIGAKLAEASRRI